MRVRAWPAGVACPESGLGEDGLLEQALCEQCWATLLRPHESIRQPVGRAGPAQECWPSLRQGTTCSLHWDFRRGQSWPESSGAQT